MRLGASCGSALMELIPVLENLGHLLIYWIISLVTSLDYITGFYRGYAKNLWPTVLNAIKIRSVIIRTIESCTARYCSFLEKKMCFFKENAFSFRNWLKEDISKLGSPIVSRENNGLIDWLHSLAIVTRDNYVLIFPSTSIKALMRLHCLLFYYACPSGPTFPNKASDFRISGPFEFQ